MAVSAGRDEFEASGSRLDASEVESVDAVLTDPDDVGDRGWQTRSHVMDVISAYVGLMKPRVIELLLLTTVLYPLAVTGVAQAVFNRQANGSIVDGRPTLPHEKVTVGVGSRIVLGGFELRLLAPEGETKHLAEALKRAQSDAEPDARLALDAAFDKQAYIGTF